MKIRFLIIACITFCFCAPSLMKAQDNGFIPADAYTSFTDKQGYVWIGTKNGLQRFDGYNFETFRADRNHPDLLRSNDVMCIAENTAKNELWIGTKKGAYILSKADFSIRDLKILGKGIDKDELADKRINYIFTDSKGNLWVSYRNNIFHLDPDANLIKSYTTQWNGTNRSSMMICEDSEGNFWTNLWNGGLCRLEKGSNVFEPCQWKDPDYPETIAFDQKKRQVTAVTANSGKTYRYNIKGQLLTGAEQKKAEPTVNLSVTDEPHHLPPLPIKEQTLCTTSGKNGEVYIGTTRHLYRYRQQGQQLDTVVTDAGKIHDIYVSKKGKVYFVSNENGVCTVENGKMRHLAESRSFSSITADGDSCLWIASKFGNVYQMTMNPPFELKDDTIAGNLNGDEVLKVRADNKGRLWILSAGIVKEYNTKTKGCRIATTQQLKTGTFTDFFLENDGIRIIGTEGETRLKETESLGKDKGIRNICVSAYTIDGQHFLTTANELPIDSKCKALTLFLTAFVFDTPADITFSYRIDNGEWVDMEKGDNSISFSQIPYGNSNVQVKARDAYGQWSDTFNVITISHPRPWYSHLWIPALIAILAGGLWAYHKRKRIQKQQLADRIRKYEAEKDELTLKLQEAERKAEEMGYEKEDTDSEYAALSAADRQLMEKAKGFVTNNLTNVEYGVDELSSDLCMSRNNLYRKMKAIIGKSPTDFIRDIRLEHAAMLLSTSSYSVNEISDLTGFSYPSYFTKCFKDKYGKSPKEYRN